MCKRVLLILLTLSLLLLAGCGTFNREMTKAFLQRGKTVRMKVQYGGGAKYTLTNSMLKEIEFAGEIGSENVNVCYQRGLETQADCIASETSRLLREVENRTGVEIFVKPRLHLLRLDQIPQCLDVRTECEEPNELSAPLFVEAGNESCQAILSQNVIWPSMLTHELVEISLILPRERGTVLADPKWRFFWFRGDIPNYTRWFRDGFANYASYLAYELSSQDKDFSADQNSPAARARVLRQPFSSLSKVGRKLFSWHQSSSDRLSRDYYNAALGLFLLIKDRFGEHAIRQIILKINEQNYLDGPDLIEITNETLNTDIRELAESFHFPETGLKMRELTPALILNEGLGVKQGLFVTGVDPKSPADEAGIRKKDVIIKVDDKPVEANLDFELIVFKLIKHQNIKVLVWRDKAGEITIELPLTAEKQSAALRDGAHCNQLI